MVANRRVPGSDAEFNSSNEHDGSQLRTSVGDKYSIVAAEYGSGAVIRAFPKAMLDYLLDQERRSLHQDRALAMPETGTSQVRSAGRQTPTDPTRKAPTRPTTPPPFENACMRVSTLPTRTFVGTECRLHTVGSAGQVEACG